MNERHTKSKVVYEVLQGQLVICGAQMGLTKQEAENKVANERRVGSGNNWSIRPVPVQMEQK